MAALSNESLHDSADGQWCQGLLSQAASFKEQGMYKQALLHYTDALGSVKKLFGEESTEIASVYNNMGSIYKKQRDFPKALEYYFNELKIGLLLGADHPGPQRSRYPDPDAGFTYHHLADCYRSLGDELASLECYEKCLEIWLPKLGPDDPKVLATQKEVAVDRPVHEALVLNDQGQHDESMAVFAKALIKAKELFGKYMHTYIYSYIHIHIY